MVPVLPQMHQCQQPQQRNWALVKLVEQLVDLVHLMYLEDRLASLRIFWEDLGGFLVSSQWMVSLVDQEASLVEGHLRQIQLEV